VLTALASLAVIVTLFAPAPEATAAKKSPKSTTTTTMKPSIECTASELSYTGPGFVSPTTGEDAFTITLTNVGTRLCQIHGYPIVHFYTSAGRLLTFAYRHTSLYFPRLQPRVVNLAPRAHAYFVVAKYRCDLGVRYASSFFYVLAPYTTGQPWVGHPAGGQGVMDYCKGSAHGPGQSLGISPIVATRRQLVP
jgi:hypothetical protein